MKHRPRRLRSEHSLRSLVAETTLTPSQFILPLFVTEGETSEIPSMPGQFRWSLRDVANHLKEATDLGLKAALLFASIEEKDKTPGAEEALNPKGLLPRALATIKDQFPNLMLFSDVALDPYSSDGHDGLLHEGEVLNDETVMVLKQMAVVHAGAGADFVAPSDMMDGRVGAIRDALDEAAFSGVGIMSYTAKYASSFYGPFRDALDSAPKAGDKKTYQMDYRNRREALRELDLDQREGADIVMVKPALCYLDVISDFKSSSRVPVAAYNVSGEYAMIKWAAHHGSLQESQARDEMLFSIRRAGADLIASYFALDFARDFARG